MADYTLEEIDQAIVNADKAGRRDDVLALAGARQRVISGQLPTEKARLVNRARETGAMNPADLYQPEEKMTFGQGMDMGLEDIVLGARQLFGSQAATDELQERQRYAPNSGAGSAGRLVGQGTAAMAPGGAAAKLAGAAAGTSGVVPAWLAEGVAGGMAEGLVYPTYGDNPAQERAINVGAGGLFGLGGAAAGNAMMRGGTGVANIPRRADNTVNSLLESSAGRSQGMSEGARLAQTYGVDMTQGQMSGAWGLQFAEQRARESFISGARVAEGDAIRANQYMQAIQSIAGDTSSAQAARNLQGQANNFVRDIAKRRSAWGRQAYGAIDDVAKGAKIVQPRKLYDELTAIIQEAGTQEQGDIVTAARQARAMLEQIDKQGGYTAQEALSRLQSWSQHGSAKVFDEVTPGYDKVLKGRIYRAILSDMDDTAAQGGTIGEMVREANKGWAQYSSQIDGLKQSALGKMVGEEVANDLMQYNTIPPEQVFDHIRRMRPSEAKYVFDFMQENMPSAIPEIRAGILNDAIEQATMGAATGGGPGFDPAGFLRSLGLKSGKAGVEGMGRLEALFGAGTKEWAQVQDLIGIGYRMADAQGRNFSGTSAGNQFFDILRDVASGSLLSLKRIGSTAAELGGLRKIGESMNPLSGTFGALPRRPLIEPPRVIQRNLGALGVATAAGALPESRNQE